eukprot:16530-Eustigmatos_ZCMA.PRE.1
MSVLISYARGQEEKQVLGDILLTAKSQPISFMRLGAAVARVSTPTRSREQRAATHGQHGIITSGLGGIHLRAR